MDDQTEALLKAKTGLDGKDLADKIKYLGMQMETMPEDEKLKVAGNFEKLAKSLIQLQRLIRKKMPDNTWRVNVWLCVAVLILIYAFFGYKLYKYLVEPKRKREEKQKAKQSKKKN